MDLDKKIDFPDKKFCFNIILTHSRNNQRRSKDRIYAIEILSLTLLIGAGGHNVSEGYFSIKRRG